MHIADVIAVKRFEKFAANQVAQDSASVNSLDSTEVTANFVGSACGCAFQSMHISERSPIHR